MVALTDIQYRNIIQTLLLDIEERERDAAIEGSRTWQAHHKKVISLENQIHTVQKRIDKAHMDKAYCESKMSA